MTSTPRSCGQVGRSPHSSCRRCWLTLSASQVDSDRYHCRPCTAPCWAPTTGSVPARAVRVLLRSPGSSRPAGRRESRAVGPASRTAYRTGRRSPPAGRGRVGRQGAWSLCTSRAQAAETPAVHPSHPQVNKLPLKKFAPSSDMVVAHHRDRPQWRKNENGRWWVWRIRWMPRSAAATTSSRVSPARLASSMPLRLDHSGSTGFSSGA
jgi:hypothetical protein